MKKIFVALCMALFAAACGTADTTDTAASAAPATPTADVAPTPAPLEIIGTWMDPPDFGGGNETITATTWAASFASATIVSFDNDTNTAILQNAADDKFSPSKFNKVVWTDIKDNAFYYCWVAFGLDTAEAAKNDATTADSSDPATKGCGGFSWTKLNHTAS